MRVTATESAKGFNNSVGSGVQAAGARGEVPRQERWRNSSSCHIVGFFSRASWFLTLELLTNANVDPPPEILTALV